MNPLDVKRFSAAGFLAALFWTVLSGPVGAVVPGSSGAAPDGLSHPSLTAPADDTRPVMTVAWPDTLVNPYDAFTIHETIAALKERLRGYCIRTATFAAAESAEQLERLRPDFIFARSVFPLDAGVSSVRIATRRLKGLAEAERAVGAAFVVRSDSHYRTLRDLKDRTVFSSLPTAIDGWLAAERVFRREGIDPTRLFARVVRRNNDYPDVVGAILSGRADMAVVPACLLETLGDEGLADVSGLRVLESEESKSAPVIPCRYSTELYPDISLLALPHAPSEMVLDMTIAILSLRNTAGAEWLTNVSHAGVDALLKELQLGPWAYLRDMSPAALYARHRTAFWLAAGLLLFLIFNELRLDRLVRRRTEDLRRSMAEQERLSAVAAATRTQLAMFERRSVVQQMSGMIAHEINAPVGAAFVVRSDSHYRTLRDLKDRTVFSSLPTAIDGWLAAERVFRREGIDPTRLFARVVRRNNDYPDVVGAILSGRADMAVVPACLLETLGDEGLADVSGLRVLESEESKSAPVIPCRYSTELYPDISLLALPHAPSEMVLDMTIAILSLRNTAGAEWLTNVSHAGVDALLKELQLGPWAYLRDMSPAALYARHRTAFWLAAGLLLFLIFNELRLDRLVRRRTEDLRRSMAEQERLSAVAAATRTQLAMFERRSVVQQMSGMIAHEINAPVGAIRTWAALARIKCPTAAVADPAAAEALSNALSRIDGEATRIADIVSRVRKYARREHERVAICELDAIVESAVRAYRAEERSDARVPINVAVAERQAGVFGQPLELEVLVLNLVRNAASAVRRLDCLKGPEVAVGVELVRVADGRWRITVENPGPVLSAQVFEKLNARAEGLACEVLDGEADREIPEGLGLGLTICRGIADSHGATLRFEARPEGGVRATVEIDAAGPAGEDTEGRKTMKVNEQGEDA